MPMFWAYAVTKGTDIYVNGGSSIGGREINHVLRFNLLKNEWVRLPPSGLHHCVPVIIEGRLTLIGGRMPINKVISKHINAFNEDSGQWESYYPDMIQPRYRPGVVVHGDYLIVLGGKIKERSTMTNTIEVMHIPNKTWNMLAIRLPKKMYDMQVTVSQGLLWIVGYDTGRSRSSKVYSIPVDHLTSSPNVKHSWKQCQDTNYYKMSIIPSSNPLIALGGDTQLNKVVSAVVACDPATGSWDEVVSLSSPRAYCAVTSVNEQAILVIGGSVKTENLDAVNSSCLKCVEMYCIKSDSRKV